MLVLLLALFASGSSASTVTAVGDTFTVNFNGIVDYGNPQTATVMPGLTASAQFTISSWSYNGGTGKTTVAFNIVIDNTSDTQVWQSAVVTSIGFDTNPNALSGTSSGVFTRFVAGGSFPTGAGFNVEYCASGNRNNCNGPGNTPLNVNDPNGTAVVTMVFSGNLSTLDFTNFGIRWQALDSQKLGLSGGSGIGVETTTPPIPEPASMALFGLGALMVGAVMRKRAQA
ncbi:MAG: cistern family PEP-CTERM protein [Myxococcota bacterium]